MIDLAAAVHEAHDLEPLPASVSRLAALVGDDDAQLKDIVEVISLDQALTGAVLRASNSAALGRRGSIASVKEALGRLGSGTVLSLAVACRVRGKMRAALPAYGLSEGELWQHSVAAALAAELAAEVCRVRIPPETFTAALIHDIGKLVLVRFFRPEVLRVLAMAREQGIATALEAETDVLGVHHGELGQIVAQAWGLPAPIPTAIAEHHAPPDNASVTSDVVHLADVVAKRIGLGRDQDSEIPDVLPGTRERLGLTDAGLTKLCERTERNFERVLDRYGA